MARGDEGGSGVKSMPRRSSGTVQESAARKD
jgi:hypothetical protein